MNIGEVDRELSNLASAVVLDKATRDAVKHAGVLLRTFRSALDLPWGTDAAELYELACNVIERPCEPIRSDGT